MNKLTFFSGVAALAVLVLTGCHGVSPELAAHNFKVDADSERCILSCGDRVLTLHPGSRSAELNGILLQLPAAVDYESRTYSLDPLVIDTVVVPLLADGAQLTRPVKKVMLDPGHGGRDSGARGARALEKELNLKLAAAIREELVKRGFEVVMTREDDTFVSLDERAQRSAAADIFISVHHNAASNRTARGIETFAARPRRAVRFHDAASTRLAFEVQRAMTEATGVVDRGVKFDRFVVIRKSHVPAILLEGGFISTPEEEKLIASEDFRRKIAVAVATAVERFSRDAIIVEEDE